MKRVVALLFLLIPVPAHASNTVGISLTLCGSKNGCPAATQTPAPTPTPNGGSGGGNCSVPGGASPVDPNLLGYACHELKFLYSLEGKNSQHFILDNQSQFGLHCYGNHAQADCQSAFNDQTSEAGNNLVSASIDPSSINQGGGTPLASFGSSSAAFQMGQITWNAGGIVIAHTDFMNPIVAWNNPVNSGTVNAAQCPPGPQAGVCNNASCWGSIYDCNNNSGESWQTYVQRMVQPGTTENSRWNTELDFYTQTWQAFQNAGIPVLVSMNQEDDATSLWYGTSNITLGEEVALRQYAISRWESEGIHNLLYVYNPITGVYDWPGCNVTDVTGYDDYSPDNSGAPYTSPLYTALAQTAANCGKPNMPQIEMEIGNINVGAFYAYVSNKSGEPDMVLGNFWSIDSCPTEPPNYTTCDPSWPSVPTNPWVASLSTISAGR